MTYESLMDILKLFRNKEIKQIYEKSVEIDDNGEIKGVKFDKR